MVIPSNPQPHLPILLHVPLPLLSPHHRTTPVLPPHLLSSLHSDFLLLRKRMRLEEQDRLRIGSDFTPQDPFSYPRTDQFQFQFRLFNVKDRFEDPLRFQFKPRVLSRLNTDEMHQCWSEGGFAPNVQDSREGIVLLTDAIEKAGYTGKKFKMSLYGDKEKLIDYC